MHPVGMHIFQALRGQAVLVAAATCAGLSTLAAWGLLGWRDYAAAQDARTLVLLACLMLVVAGLREEGVLQRIAYALAVHTHSDRALAGVCVGLCFFGSMLVTNDVSLLVFVPFAFAALNMTGSTHLALRVVVLQAVAANLGSSLSPVGNPQNIFLQSHYAISLGEFFSVMGPIVAVGGIAIVLLVAALVPRADSGDILAGQNLRPLHRGRIALLTGLFGICLACVAGILPVSATGAIVGVVALVAFRNLFAKIDWGLLLTFVCFFVFTANLQALPVVAEALRSLVGANPFAAAVASSQVISNVPAAVLLANFTTDGAALLAGTNIGGLGTPIASLASLIAWRLYTQHSGAPAVHFLPLFSAVNFGLLALLCVVHTI